MNLTKPGQTAEWLLDAWIERLVEALETMTGERPRAAWKPAGEPEGEAAVLWWEQPLSLAPDAVVWAGAPEAAWREIGAFTLRGAGLEVGSPEEAKKTYLEILGQALSGIARSIGDKLGATISCEPGREISGPPARLNTFEVRLTLGETALPAMPFRFGPALVQILEAANAAPSREEAGASRAMARADASGAPASGPASGANPQTLDLLLDVELPVSVSFGRAEIPLKDALKLTTGSIVELNRSISEPVEVIVNNCVIARGEVVVVDGSYGVKIQEIVSRDRRLKTVR